MAEAYGFLGGRDQEHKTKIIKSMRMALDKAWTQRRLEGALNDTTYSYNDTE